MPRGGVTAPDTVAPPADPVGTDPGPSMDPGSRRVADLMADVRRSATEHGRGDIADRLETVATRVARTETIVCVVGEFKKGKSALINALLASPVCPVDDDLATTAVTVVGYAERPSATVRRRDDGKLVVDSIPTDDVRAWVLEREDADRQPGVELVEIGLPNAFLGRGMTLVDTPGVGGLNAGHAAATLAFLPSADALVFVTDASAELSAPELAFLASARQAGRPILVAVTKVDMYPEWRRIVEIDERHLGTMGLTERPFALSSVLRMHGDELGDRTLERDSGFPVFGEALVGDVVGRARTISLSGALAQIGPAIEQLREPFAAELAALERPDDAEQLAADLGGVRARLAALDAADASWSVRLEDEFAALRTRITFAFQGQMRHVVRAAQDELERIDPAGDWPGLSGRIQERTASAVRGAFLEATNGAADIQSTIARLLADEEIGLDSTGVPISFDVQTMWHGGPEFDGRARSGLLAGFGVLTGAQVGVEMLGMLGALLGAAIVGPAVLGVAVVFGGKEVLSERKRQLADRRQQARTFFAEFVEEVRFEADGRLSSLLDEIQRQMRARFADRIRELHRTYTESEAALERAAEQAGAERAARLPAVRSELEALDALGARAVAIAQPQTT
jgi:hypothetical protein